MIATGRQQGESSKPHRLTVFACFYVEDPAGMAPRNPDVLPGWEAVATAPGRVIEALQSLIDAGADSIVLVPLGSDQESQLRLAASAIAPQLVK